MAEEEEQTNVIDRFINKFAFLSNFYPSTISYDGKLWPTVEHVYQAYKSLDENVRVTIHKARSPGEAKKLGQLLVIREDWEPVKVDLMRTFVKKKFENPFLREMLLATGDAKLVEGNYWNDKFWGVCRGVGQNWLGRILMDVREQVRQELKNEPT
jgi:ribA/ribD-fused uncharacterized protein